ncbi:hypothetical protein M378DRAFT_166181 [Amanita muscaria Koide BX008]|uniref:Uncharacterized protein n=1 Tax=Amanita muscaria (strain Koide BX008) TaxID=946122 RepID=A0A0C2X049_AMAMK|nr:hypothetical protein M378DRAFT_166181 [Amanita muscaria Koide BX008]
MVFKVSQSCKWEYALTISSAPTAPASRSFNESQKKIASDFEAAVPKDTGGMEAVKKGKGKAKSASADAEKGGGQTSGTAARRVRARANRNATTAQGLCKNAFLKSRGGATVDEWETYWNGLDESERKIWEEQSAKLINSRKSNGGGGEAGVV